MLPFVVAPAATVLSLVLLLLLPNFQRCQAFQHHRQLKCSASVSRRRHASLLYAASTTTADPVVADDVPDATDSLTLDELAQRLRQVRAQTRSDYAGAPASPDAIAAQLALCDQLHSTRFRNLALDRTEARPSSVHGTGLFATRAIATEELLTLYPGDALLAWGDEYGGKPGPDGCPLQALYGPHITDAEQASTEFFLIQDSARDFEVVTGKRRSIVGDPARKEDPAYLGHLANDAACFSPGGDVGTYKEESGRGANAAHFSLEGCHFATVATRAIAKDEEILVSYGEGYWETRTVGDFSAATAGKAARKTKSKNRQTGKQNSKGFGKR